MSARTSWTKFFDNTVNYMDRQVMAVVLQPMKLDLGLSDLQMGVINSMFYVGVRIFWECLYSGNRFFQQLHADAFCPSLRWRQASPDRSIY